MRALAWALGCRAWIVQRRPEFMVRDGTSYSALVTLCADMRGERLIRYAEQDLNPFFELARRRFGYEGPPRFAGVRISAPDVNSAWGIAYQIAGGEYAYPGFEPAPGERVVDIGANVGLFSLWAARRGASVTAYEPAPLTLEHLRTNTGASESIAVRGGAVVGSTYNAPTVQLYLHEESSTRNTLTGTEIGTGAALGRSVEVPAIPIDEVLDRECDLLKVDCEGGEFDILKDVKPTVLRRARRIVMEFHRSAGDPDILLDALRASGFEASIFAGADADESFGVIGASRQRVPSRTADAPGEA